MLRSLYTAATGMKANQLYIDNISNNLSNVNTSAFKKSRLEFEDLMYQTLVEPSGGTTDGATSPSGLQVGLGVRNSSNQKIFAQGSLLETKSPLDLAIQGSGLIQVQLPGGDMAYTRDGSLKIGSDGSLVTSQGFAIEPSIVIPEGSKEIGIDASGKVSVLLNDSGVAEEIGQLELVKFINEGGLKSIGQNLYQSTSATGDPEIGIPGENGLGTIAQGFMEASNVEMVEEMVGMILAQRAYEISAKAIQTSDSMLQMANQLKS